MALYEYVCQSCNAVTERRMPMTDVLAHIKCPECGRRAKKAFATFALVGVAESSLGDGPAPWDDDGDGGGFDPEGSAHGHDHGHSHDFGGMDDDLDDDLDF